MLASGNVPRATRGQKSDAAEKLRDLTLGSTAGSPDNVLSFSLYIKYGNVTQYRVHTVYDFLGSQGAV